MNIHLPQITNCNVRSAMKALQSEKSYGLIYLNV